MNRLGTMVMPFTGVYLTQARGLSVAAAGLVMALFGAGSLVSQLLAGVLADRIGRRSTLAGGMLATAAAMLALGYSTTLPAILASMFMLGLVADAYRPASNALVADLISPQERPRAYGLLFWAINLGYSVGMTAGGWLAQAGYLWLFWVDAVTAVAFGLPGLAGGAGDEARRDERHGKREPDESGKRARGSFAETCCSGPADGHFHPDHRALHPGLRPAFTTLPLAMTREVHHR